MRWTASARLDPMTRIAVPSEMMQCTDVAGRLTDYHEAALPDAEQRQIEDHLKGCAACARLSEELQRTTELLRRSATATHAPSQIKRALGSVFRATDHI